MSALNSYSDIPLLERRKAPVPSKSQDDSFIYLGRQSRHLQRQIQSLLDAQSDGLLAGMRSPTYENSDILSNESSTSPTSATRSLERATRTIPVRQPSKKKIGLRSARKGILKSMSDLLSLKEEEKKIIQDRIRQRQDAIEEIDMFANKKSGLENTISNMENDREGKRARMLKAEAKCLAHDIEELELRLAGMKAKYRHLIQEVSRIENTVDAKLSSYKESLSILDREVSRYLENPPLQPLQPDVEKSSFYFLHPKRRTLEMARDHWQTEQSELTKRQNGVDLEIAALDDGGPVWQSVVKEVSDFEKRLKNETQQFVMSSKSMLPEADDEMNQQKQGKRILDDLEITTRHVEEKLELAQEKDWRLLVCSIGTELAALREAQNMLKEIYGQTDYNQQSEFENASAVDNTGDSNNNNNNNNNSTILRSDQPPPKAKDIDASISTLKNPHSSPPPPTITVSEDEHADEPPADLLKDAISEEGKPSTPTPRYEDEDDEPDPAWLLSDP